MTGTMQIPIADKQEPIHSTNGDTTYHQQAAATSSDVQTGSTVKVQVNGFRGGRFGGGGANASPAPSGAPQTTATDITVVP